ncbi:MAG: hypothetical protein AAB693_01540 [Patescibacteria group bacterium]
MVIKIINHIKEDLNKTIIASLLTEEQKNLWLDLINKITDEEVVAIFDTLQNDSNILSFLTKNLQDKLQAINSKDESLWQTITKDEEEYINSNS